LGHSERAVVSERSSAGFMFDRKKGFQDAVGYLGGRSEEGMIPGGFSRGSVGSKKTATWHGERPSERLGVINWEDIKSPRGVE